MPDVKPAQSAGAEPLSQGGGPAVAPPSKELYIRFMAPVVPQTTDKLLRLVDGAINGRYARLHLMISSPGGSVFHGLSVYNFLCGAPIEVYTYNFGSVDSIGVVIYCAGNKRFSVPHARFLLHGVRMGVQGNASFDEKQVEEQLKGLRIDEENIARVIADTTKKPLHEIKNDMHERTALNPQQAKDYGLAHEIKSELFPIGAELAVVREIPDVPPPTGVVHVTAPAVQAHTRSRDIDISSL